MGKEKYHSPGKVNKQHNAVKNKVRFTYLQGEFDLFFVAFNAINIPVMKKAEAVKGSC